MHVPTLLVDLAKQLPSVGPSRHVHHHGAGRLPHLFWVDDGRAFQGGLVTHVPQHNTNVLFVSGDPSRLCPAFGPDYRGWLSGGFEAGLRMSGLRIGPLGLSSWLPIWGFQPSFRPLLQP
jgi:hypothetical protein